MESAKGSAHNNHRSRIFITSSVDDHQTIRAAIQDCGADVFLNKPLDLNDLKELLIQYSFFPSAPAPDDSHEKHQPRTVELDMGMATGTTG